MWVWLPLHIKQGTCISNKVKTLWNRPLVLSPKKICSRKKKINLGSNQQHDCVVILDADRKSSVILEADQSQIPIASLVDSTIPLGFYIIITYPIPANNPRQFVYLFRHSITKTVILEWGKIVAMKEIAEEERTHRSTFCKKILF